MHRLHLKRISLYPGCAHAAVCPGVFIKSCLSPQMYATCRVRGKARPILQTTKHYSSHLSPMCCYSGVLDLLDVKESAGCEGHRAFPRQRVTVDESIHLWNAATPPWQAVFHLFSGSREDVDERMRLVLIIVLSHVSCSPYLEWFISNSHTEQRTCQSSLVLALMPVYEPRHERVAIYK